MSAETPRYVDTTTGKSNEHAIEMAEKLDHASRADFKEIVKAQQFPPKNGLYAPHHIATDVDSKGILDWLKQVNPATRLGEPKYAQLSYGHMFKKINVEMPNADHKEAGKIYDINALEPGDEVWLDKGVLWVKRREGSKFASWGCEIYPWTEGGAVPTVEPAAEPAPEPAVEPAPEPAVDELTRINSLTEAAEIETAVKDYLKENGYDVLDNREYDFTAIRAHLPDLVAAKTAASANPQVAEYLANETIILGMLNTTDESFDGGFVIDAKNNVRIAVNYDHPQEDIKRSIIESAEDLVVRKNLQNSINTINANNGCNLQLFEHVRDYNYDKITENLPELTEGIQLFNKTATKAQKEKLRTVRLYPWQLTGKGRDKHGDYLMIAYGDSSEMTAQQIKTFISTVYPETATTNQATPAPKPSTLVLNTEHKNNEKNNTEINYLEDETVKNGIVWAHSWETIAKKNPDNNHTKDPIKINSYGQILFQENWNPFDTLIGTIKEDSKQAIDMKKLTAALNQKWQSLRSQ